MLWLKRNRWKAFIAFAGLLLLLVFMVWVPMSAGAHEGTSGLATPVMVQATLTVDTTMTALSKEQLTLQVKQLQNQLQNQNNWLVDNSTALIAAVATVVVALFGISQWAINRRDERRKEITTQDKELRDRAEERFQIAVTALGDENEATQVGGAILLRSFLNKDDKKIYARYYIQIFDLAVAYLRLSKTNQPSEDPDRLPPPPEGPNTVTLTTLRQTLASIFREVFPLARSQNTGERQSLDASGVMLDNTYFARAYLIQAWMPESSLRSANLNLANLTGATLREADLTRANLTRATLSGANLRRAIFIEAQLHGVDFTEAYMRNANLRGASLNTHGMRNEIISSI